MFLPIQLPFNFLLVLGCIGLCTPALSETACGNSPQAVQLAELIRKHPQQSRAVIRCNAKLTQIAVHKATLLSENNIIMHNIGHKTPNQLLRAKGYPLSEVYPALGNQVEALAAGENNAKKTLQQLLNSKNHRRLLLGEVSFYQPQNEMGVAYVRQTKSPFDYYWVIYIADDDRIRPEPEYTVNSEYRHIESEKKTSVRDRHRQSRYARPKMSSDN